MSSRPAGRVRRTPRLGLPSRERRGPVTREGLAHPRVAPNIRNPHGRSLSRHRPPHGPCRRSLRIDRRHLRKRDLADPAVRPGGPALASGARLEQALKSARRTRPRIPTCSAGGDPWSIQLRTVCWFSFRIEATSATVMKSSACGMSERYPLRRRCPFTRGQTPFRLVPTTTTSPPERARVDGYVGND